MLVDNNVYIDVGCLILVYIVSITVFVQDMLKLNTNIGYIQ